MSLYRVTLFAFALLVAGCSSDDASRANPSVDASPDADADADAGIDASATDAADAQTPSADEATFEAMLAGAIGAHAGLVAIANGGGWPIETASGFVFAALDDAASPYRLAGDFNGWQPEPMQAGPGFHWVRVAIASPNGAKYKLVSAAEALVADPFARRYGYDENGEHSLVRESGPHLERFVEIGTGTLPARMLRVWVPALAPTHHLYVHDGQNLFDPGAPFGGWKFHESVSSTTLVVGIDNAGAARMHEYTHVPDQIGGQVVGGGADEYAAFVTSVVVPLVEARHGMPTRRGVMGSSLGGLVAFHQVLADPSAWQFAASLSGTFGWGSIGANNETLIQRFAAATKLDVPLYLDSGGGPGSGCVDSDDDGTNDDATDAADNFCENDQLEQTLEAAGWQHGVDLFHWHEPGAPHNEAAWAARVFRPVEQFEAL